MQYNIMTMIMESVHTRHCGNDAMSPDMPIANSYNITFLAMIVLSLLQGTKHIHNYTIWMFFNWEIGLYVISRGVI